MKELTRLEAIEIAKYWAMVYSYLYNYIPGPLTEEFKEWEPHEWVIQALIELSTLNDEKGFI